MSKIQKKILKNILINKNNNNINIINNNNYGFNLDTYNKIVYPKNNFNKTLILYVFDKFNYMVDNFIKNGIFEDNKFDFLIIINDINFDINRLTELNLPSYIKYFIRENKGFDFGGWSEGLLKDNLYLNYDSFIFINSTVYGPYIDKSNDELWPNILLNGLNYNNRKLFGTTINGYSGNSHVQSMVFCMDIITLKFLIQKNIFSLNYCTSKDELVNKKEIKMSRDIINNGWNIGCLHSYYKDTDFRSENKNVKLLNDLCFKNRFRGKTIHPYEILFVKGNRNIDIDKLNALIL